MKHSIKINVLLIVSISAAPLYAQTSVESAAVHFYGAERTDDLFATAISSTNEFIGEEGQGNFTQIQASGTAIKSITQTTDNSQKETTWERRGSIGATQTFKKLTSLGGSYGYTQTENLSTWYALRASRWINRATILANFEYTKTSADRTPRDYLDTDGRRVLTPSNTKGSSYSLSLTWLATRNAMVLGSASTTVATDRPKSNSASGEVRYFVNQTLTAIHAKVGAYEDSTQVEKTTDFGKISAREWELQLHQHLNDQFIATLVGRDHFEVETPRSADSDIIHRHSRMTQVRLRDRFVTGPITESVSEIYIFAGKYQSFDASQSIHHVGLGGIYVL